MSFFNKLFIVKISEKRWHKIILWWELRRIPYNIALLVFLYISLRTIAALPQNGYIKLYTGPVLVIGIYLSIFLYFAFANLCYSLGWLAQLTLKNVKHPLVKVFLSRSFILGSTISIVITLSPILIWVLNLVINEIL